MSSSVQCNDHNRPVVIFCTECDVPICDMCLVSKDHRGHPRSSLKDACETQMADLAKSTKELEGKMRKRGSVPALEPIMTDLENNFSESKENINKLYEELEAIVEKNKQSAFRLLDAMEKQLSDKLFCVEEKAEEILQEMTDISNSVQELQDEADQNSADTLKKYKEQEKRIEELEMYVNWESSYKFDNIRLESLVRSVNAILEMSKAFLPCPWEFSEFIKFDKNMAHERLRVSEDKRQVTFPVNNNSSSKKKMKSHHHDGSFLSVLAEQCFSAGKQYWEVDVRECPTWAAGVLQVQPGQEASPLEHDAPSWTLESEYGDLSAACNGDSYKVTEEDLSILGILLDCDKHCLRFYNVVTGAALHSFRFHRGQTMRPVFSIGPLVDKSSSLVLCDLHQEATERPESLERPESVTTEGPESVATEAPESVATEAPESVATEAPESVATEAPESVATEGPESLERPESVTTEAPESVATEAPESVATEAPESVATEAPESVATEAPESVATEAPESVATEGPESVPDTNPPLQLPPLESASQTPEQD